jgi:acetyl esterase/lipase
MARSPRRLGVGTIVCLPLVAAALLLQSACRMSDVSFWGPVTPADAVCEVVKISNIDYGGDTAGDPFRHQLDLYLPRGLKDVPVVMFVHGGAWMIGDNRCSGLYSAVGAFLASHGIAAVLPNYRLSPDVKHPEHITDVARAFAWAHSHIAEYGGLTDRLFLAGHSAGGHLAALLATDDRYLKTHGLSTADIRGVIAISGVYRIPPGKMHLELGGNDTMSFRLDQIVPLHGDSGTPPASLIAGGIPVTLNVFGPAFGDNPHVREDASPIKHVHQGLPPFLLFHAEHDLPTLAQMAADFHQALLAHGCDAELYRVAGRNHHSIMFSATEPADPVGRAMLEFIHQHR